MKGRSLSRLILAACVAAIVALGLMSWSLFDPRPMPVVLAMSVGQALGTLSFVVYLIVVANELRRAHFSPDEPDETVASTRE